MRNEQRTYAYGTQSLGAQNIIDEALDRGRQLRAQAMRDAFSKVINGVRGGQHTAF